MLPTESVLTEQELYEQNLEQQQLSGSATTTTVGLGEQEEGETETSEYEEVEEELEVGVELERTHLGGGGGERRGTIRGGERPMPPLNGGGGGKLNGGWATKDGGVKVAEIKLRQWKEVISVADVRSSYPFSPLSYFSLTPLSTDRHRTLPNPTSRKRLSIPRILPSHFFLFTTQNSLSSL